MQSFGQVFGSLPSHTLLPQNGFAAKTGPDTAPTSSAIPKALRMPGSNLRFLIFSRTVEACISETLPIIRDII